MVNDIVAGQRIDRFFIIRKIKLRTSKKKNEQYLSLELGDASGRIFGTIWDHIDLVRNLVQEGDLVNIKAKSIDWKGRPHLSIEKIRLATERDNISLTDFYPKSSQSPELMNKQLLERIEQIQDPHYKALLQNIFQNDKIKSKLIRAPGGKLWHHCYEGGLLEHTLSVLMITEKTAMLYENINMDLLLTGALLHDIGKVYELGPGPVIDYTDKGRLLGHISIGYHLIASEMDAIPEFPENKQNEILHLILSHQGQLDHGSPVVPMSREAFILYYADELDSKMNAFDRIYKKEKVQNKTWSTFVKLLDRFLYFGDKKNNN